MALDWNLISPLGPFLPHHLSLCCGHHNTAPLAWVGAASEATVLHLPSTLIRQLCLSLYYASPNTGKVAGDGRKHLGINGELFAFLFNPFPECLNWFPELNNFGGEGFRLEPSPRGKMRG